ncbi:MAG: Asp23/Gls24 family envelope stress response protein [Lachnospiraceae bacterium]|nr:Asp23/Gls24 family envelope stress response protein [Lachnospiraceae bacterium]
MSQKKEAVRSRIGYEEGTGKGVMISNEVISAVAAIAALGTDGVYALNGGTTYEHRNKLSSKTLRKGVKTVCEDHKIKVYLAVQIKYGHSIPEVCDAVQERVKNHIESMTGLEVISVNIKVADVVIEGK